MNGPPRFSAQGESTPILPATFAASLGLASLQPRSSLVEGAFFATLERLWCDAGATCEGRRRTDSPTALLLNTWEAIVCANKSSPIFLEEEAEKSIWALDFLPSGTLWGNRPICEKCWDWRCLRCKKWFFFHVTTCIINFFSTFALPFEQKILIDFK